MANLVKRLSMKGKKGDTIHIPKPSRGSANAKSENTAVTVQNNTESVVDVSIDKHYEFSRLIEDITDVQAKSSLRRFYTEDAGYGLAKQVDTDLLSLGTSLGDGSGGSDWDHSASYYVDASSGLSLYAVDTVTASDVVDDDGLRSIIKLMDDNDIPMDNRFWVVPPSVRKTLMGIDRFVSTDFVTSRGVENGKIGNLYGIDIYVSTNCPVVETSGDNAAGGELKESLIAHKDTFVLAEQMGIRSQQQYKQEWLGTLYTADTLYGVKTLRTDGGFVLVVNS